MTDLRALLEAATPRPWKLFREPGGGQYITTERGISIEGPGVPMNFDDQALGVAAVNSLPHLLDRLEKAEEALRWLGSEEAWEVTPQYATDGRYRFNTTPESVYATPWGFARAALSALDEQKL